MRRKNYSFEFDKIGHLKTFDTFSEGFIFAGWFQALK